MAAKKVSMKLLIDKKNHKVLFAEANKEVVDFLFNILTLPVGTIVRLLTKQGMVGCLSNLYESIENLSDDYILPNQNKDSLLKPMVQTQVPLLLLTDSATEKKFYRCSSNYSHRYVTDYHGAICPSCGTGHARMTAEVAYVGGSAAVAAEGSGGGGFVKGVVTYMVMDDLVVQPMSTISGITLLNKFNVRDVGSLDEQVVNLDMDVGVKLLKASLQSKTVLSNVFLGKRVA